MSERDGGTQGMGLPRLNGSDDDAANELADVMADEIEKLAREVITGKLGAAN
jgi:hypothetical protein